MTMASGTTDQRISSAVEPWIFAPTSRAWRRRYLIANATIVSEIATAKKPLIAISRK